MNQSWDIFLDDSDALPLTAELLPSSMRDIITDNVVPLPITPSSQPVRTALNPFEKNKHCRSEIDEHKTLTNDMIISSSKKQYVLVSCHQNKTKIFKYENKCILNVGDIVLTEADRGYDIGQIKKINVIPSHKDIYESKNILRKASNDEISKIRMQREKEIKAREICQSKANELNLPMKITSTELQFDEKKLTVYFSADQYIDFRNLVHSLFRLFGMRIWMVWLDGQEPVRDVFTHGTNIVRMSTF